MDSKLRTISLLCAASAVIMSLPWLVPGTGFAALVGMVPLLVADRIAFRAGIRRFWVYHYGCFVLWNAITTFWVWNATPGGAIFAILANALQMSLVFSFFRLSRHHFHGILPYIFLAAAWIAWERWYLVSAEISWPWLVLGNAFAQTTRTVQWYSVTGSLGGSVWVWAVNIGIFSLVVLFSEGKWKTWTKRARTAVLCLLAAVIAGPMLWSAALYNHSDVASGTEKVRVLIAQPNFDPYQKFDSLPQDEQDRILLSQLSAGSDSSWTGLMLAPETFTSGIFIDNISASPSWKRFNGWLASRPGANLLFGASTYEFFEKKPGILARRYAHGWIINHNSAILTDTTARAEVFHKSKLVVGVELTPYPQVFVPIDNMLGGVMGRCVGQEEVSLLNYRSCGKDIPFGCAVCYESVYGEYCAEYVRKGAGFLTVITNDAWWGNTPGYRQHLSYSCLRAIETGRDIARCANTGISAIIDRKGEITGSSSWWTRETLEGEVTVYTDTTPFVRYGDIAGRICTLLFIMLLAALCVSLILKKIRI